MKEQLLWTSKTKVLLGSVEIMWSNGKNLISHVNFRAGNTCSIFILYLSLYYNSHSICLDKSKSYFNGDKCNMCYLEYSTDSGHLNDNEFNFFTAIHLFMISLLKDILIHIHSELISSLLDLGSVIDLGRVSLVSDG